MPADKKPPEGRRDGRRAQLGLSCDGHLSAWSQRCRGWLWASVGDMSTVGGSAPVTLEARVCLPVGSTMVHIPQWWPWEQTALLTGTLTLFQSPPFSWAMGT